MRNVKLWSKELALRTYGWAVMAGLLVAIQSPAHARDNNLTRSNEEVKTVSAVRSETASSDNYWTPERFRSAKPITPSVNFNGIVKPSEATKKRGVAAKKSPPSEITQPKPPAVKTKPDNSNRMFVPDSESRKAPRDESKDLRSREARADVVVQNVGTRRAHFTSSRLIPLSADLQYPYRAVGKLFFTVPGEGPAVCSAAVIKARIILTAGHCVHSGSGGVAGYFTNFVFAPAFRDGVAPLGRWNYAAVIAPVTWTTGRGAVPNAADYALIELQDQALGGAVRKIGTVTGHLGFRTHGLHPNHAHLLGYPCNLDRCLKMHQVTAQSFALGGKNTILYGSDMRQGSSGGPWIQISRFVLPDSPVAAIPVVTPSLA